MVGYPPIGSKWPNGYIWILRWSYNVLLIPMLFPVGMVGFLVNSPGASPVSPFVLLRRLRPAHVAVPRVPPSGARPDHRLHAVADLSGRSDQSEPTGKTCFRLLSSYAPGPMAHWWCLLKHGEIYVDWRKNVVDGVMKHKESAIKCNKVVGQWLAAIWVE
jgi:hypothetical protein